MSFKCFFSIRAITRPETFDACRAGRTRCANQSLLPPPSTVGAEQTEREGQDRSTRKIIIENDNNNSNNTSYHLIIFRNYLCSYSRTQREKEKERERARVPPSATCYTSTLTFQYTIKEQECCRHVGYRHRRHSLERQKLTPARPCHKE